MNDCGQAQLGLWEFAWSSRWSRRLTRTWQEELRNSAGDAGWTPATKRLVATKHCTVARCWVSAPLRRLSGGRPHDGSRRLAKEKGISSLTPRPLRGGALLGDSSLAEVLKARVESAKFFTAFWIVDVWKAKPTQDGLALQERSVSIAALSASDQLQASRSSDCVAAEVARAWRSWACRVAPPRAGRAHKTRAG